MEQVFVTKEKTELGTRFLANVGTTKEGAGAVPLRRGLEVTLLEIAPSGDLCKLKEPEGKTYWMPCSNVEIVEVLNQRPLDIILQGLRDLFS